MLFFPPLWFSVFTVAVVFSWTFVFSIVSHRCVAVRTLFLFYTYSSIGLAYVCKTTFARSFLGCHCAPIGSTLQQYFRDQHRLAKVQIVFCVIKFLAISFSRFAQNKIGNAINSAITCILQWKQEQKNNNKYRMHIAQISQSRMIDVIFAFSSLICKLSCKSFEKLNINLFANTTEMQVAKSISSYFAFSQLFAMQISWHVHFVQNFSIQKCLQTDLVFVFIQGERKSMHRIFKEILAKVHM